jgi:hypothetical protein
MQERCHLNAAPLPVPPSDTHIVSLHVGDLLDLPRCRPGYPDLVESRKPRFLLQCSNGGSGIFPGTGRPFSPLTESP